MEELMFTILEGISNVIAGASILAALLPNKTPLSWLEKASSGVSLCEKLVRPLALVWNTIRGAIDIAAVNFGNAKNVEKNRETTVSKE